MCITSRQKVFIANISDSKPQYQIYHDSNMASFMKTVVLIVISQTLVILADHQTYDNYGDSHTKGYINMIYNTI